MNYVKSIGYDDVFNYKTDTPWVNALKRVAPNGIDCFFDNVCSCSLKEILLVVLTIFLFSYTLR